MKISHLRIVVPVLLLYGLPFAGLAQLGAPENVPIGFYVKVIDQNGNPVTAANVNLDFVRSYMVENRTESTPMTFHTDKDGNFALTDVIGYSVDKLSVQKDGYELSPNTQRGYVFGLRRDYKPNPNNPVIVKMWKMGGKELLTHSVWHGKVVCDGTTNRFDLITGRPNPEGSLEVTCSRVPLNLPPGNTEPFTWGVQIKIIGGGIQSANDEFTFLAPETGYLPVLTYGQKADDPKWDRQMPMPKEYYIKTADGQHGTLSLEWDRADWKSPTILKWDCSINPSSSRNLER